MRVLHLPKPKVDTEAMAQMDFLPELRPSIDALGGSASWVLGQLAVGGFNGEFSAYQLHDKVARLGSPRHQRQVEALRSSPTVFGDYLANELQTAGLVAGGVMPDGEYRHVPLWKPTPKVSKNMGLVGVVIAEQLTSKVPFSTILGRKTPKAVENVEYPHPPTLRLFIAQLMIECQGVQVRRLAPLLGRTARQVHGILGHMQNDGIVAASGTFGHNIRYDLHDDARTPMTRLLCGLASLNDEMYAQKAREVASSLLHPERGPTAVMQFAALWRRPRKPAVIDIEAINALARQRAPEGQEADLRRRVLRLVRTGILTVITNDKGEPEPLFDARLSGMTPLERDLLMQAYDGGDVFGPPRPSDPRLAEGAARRAGYSDVGRYMEEYLIPRAKQLLRAA